MKTLLKTSLLLGLLGIVTTPVNAMERISINSAQTSSALNLSGVMSRNLSSEYPKINEQLNQGINHEFIYQNSLEPFSTETQTSQDNSFLLETPGEPEANPFRLSIVQF